MIFEKIDDQKRQNDSQNHTIIMDTSYLNENSVHNSLVLVMLTFTFNNSLTSFAT